MNKRIISCIMAICLMLSLFPVQILADDIVAQVRFRVDFMPVISQELPSDSYILAPTLSDIFDQSNTVHAMVGWIKEDGTFVLLAEKAFEADDNYCFFFDKIPAVYDQKYCIIFDADENKYRVPEEYYFSSADINENSNGDWTVTVKLENVNSEYIPEGQFISGTCGEESVWTLTEEGVLTVSGTGEIYDYDSIRETNWYFHKDSVAELSVGSGITKIGTRAFSNFSELKNAELSEGLTYIADTSFHGCVSLMEITIPSTVHSGLVNTFQGCSKLKNIYVADGNKDFVSRDGVLIRKKDHALITYPMGKTDKSYEIPDDIVDIVGWAFDGAPLEKVIIPSSIDTIRIYAFSDCSKLKSVYFMGDVPSKWYEGIFQNTHPDLTLYYTEGNTSGWTSPTWEGPDGVVYKTAVMHDFEYGDVNTDGKINGIDVTLVRRYIAGGFDLAVFIEEAADVNCDGRINGIDVTLIRRYIAGGFDVILGGGSGDEDEDMVYTVTFDANGSCVENLPVTQKVKGGERAVEPAEPTRKGFRFIGWYAELHGVKQYDFGTPINSDITLYARWIYDIALFVEPTLYITPPSNENISTSSSNGIEFINNELILHAEDNTSRIDIIDLLKNYDADIVGEILLSNTYQIKFNEIYTYDELINIKNDLEKSSVVSWISLNNVFEEESDYFIPNDTEWADDWNDVNPGGDNWGVEAINAAYAWDKYKQMDYVNVGVYDNYFLPHDDLVYEERYFNNEDVKISDDGREYHGTHVSGTIAAGFNNGKGITGVAPKVNLYGISFSNLPVTNSSNDLNSKIENFAIEWELVFSLLIQKNKCKVLNFSVSTMKELGFLASYGNNKELREKAISTIKTTANEFGRYLNNLYESGEDFVICVAAGNYNDTIYVYPHEAPVTGNAQAEYFNFLSAIDETYPEIKDRIIVVGSCGNQGDRNYSYSSFSNVGDRVDVVAPGEDIMSTLKSNTYGKMGGTSMAAPHVAGVAAMLFALDSNLTGAQVKQIIKDCASIDVSGCEYNMINANMAVNTVLNIPKKVTFKFVDTTTSSPIKAQAVSWDCFEYIGNNPIIEPDDYDKTYFIENGNESTTIDTVVTEIPYGSFKFIFSASGYQDETVECTIDDNENVITVYMTPEGAEGHTLRVKFIDSETGEKLLLTDIFQPAEYNIAQGEIYNNACIGLSNDEVADNDYGGIAGGFLNRNEIVIEDNELVFHNIVDHDKYYLAFDAAIIGYVLPYCYDRENSWDYGYFTVSGDTTISVPLDKEFLIVGDVTVTKENCDDILGDGTAVYDYASHELTLTNANITAQNVIWARLTYLDIVIPNGTTSYLVENNSNIASVIYNEGGTININGDYSDDENGTLYVKGCKTLVQNGEYSHYEYNNFCINAFYIDVHDTDLIFEDAWGAMRSEYEDIRIYRSNITEGTPYSVQAYLMNSAGSIELSYTNVIDASDSGVIMFALKDITIESSNLSYIGTRTCIDAREGILCVERDSTVHVKSIDSEIDSDLIIAGEGIYLRDPYDTDFDTAVKIVLPEYGIIYQDTEGNFSIRCADESYPVEILITPIE